MQAVKLNAGMSHSVVVTVPPVTTKKATSLCPPGQQVTGGGHMVWEGNVIIVKSTALIR